MRRRLAIIGLIVLTPFAALVGWWLMPEPCVTAANCERVGAGMTLEQVEEILGASDEGFIGGDPVGAFGESGYEGVKIWQGGGCLIVVDFRDGRVRHKLFDEVTPWQRIDDWYHGNDRRPALVMAMYYVCS
jgi:hypothetical protein